jgi:hypothetical protein
MAVSVSISASHPCISTITNCSIPSSSSWKVSTSRITWQKRGCCRAMVQVQTGAPAAYAKEMERLSAKESLLLAVSHSFPFLLRFFGLLVCPIVLIFVNLFSFGVLIF